VQRLWRKEDNNTSKPYSTGRREVGGEQASKGLQNKVKKVLRQRDRKMLPLWDSEKWRKKFILNVCYSKNPRKPYGTWTRGPGPFCQVRHCCLASAALQPGLTDTSTHH